MIENHLPIWQNTPR